MVISDVKFVEFGIIEKNTKTESIGLRKMKKEFKNVVEAYYWVQEHPSMLYKKCIGPWMELTPHMVNPENQIIETDKLLNTALWWCI